MKPFLMGAETEGCFLEEGGRLYADIEGHPEYATPEVATPAAEVRSTLAAFSTRPTAPWTAFGVQLAISNNQEVLP